MKISLDLDGTVWSKMAFFRELMIAFQQRGNEVGILTGHSDDMKAKDIELLMARGFPCPSFYFGRTHEFMHLNGAHFKSMVIEREGIDLHFDDNDYDHSDTNRLMIQLGQHEKLAKMTARTPIEVDGRKVHYE